jgi:signal transduction histidine kinase
MSRALPAARRLSADPGDFAPLTERVAYLAALRVGTAGFVVAVALRYPELARGSTVELAVVSAGYLILAALSTLANHRRVGTALPLVKAMLLVDGIYIAWAVSMTGGMTSPLRALFFVQVLVVTLLVAYRTGVKITAWDSLLIVAVAMQTAPQAAGARPALLSALPTLAALWVEAFITVTFSAIAEREIRRQKVDLGSLVEMGMRIEGASASEISAILLDAARTTFGFRRGVVLASPEGDLALCAVEGGTTSVIESGLDGTVEAAWASHRPALRHRLDPSIDPRLDALLPGAADVVVAPLSINEAYRVGVLVLEGAPDRKGIRRWELSLLMQFASYGALALNNAWLAEAKAAQLEEIRVLQRDLKAHNARLELAVAERTADLERVVRDLEATDTQRRRLLSRVVRAQEDERKMIANDLHDDPLQKLVSMKMRVELLMRTVDAEDLPELRDLTASCIHSLRYLLFDLRPPVLDEEGVGPAVQRLLDHWAPDFTYDVRDDVLDAVDPETRVILYRIAQEALANARKHAQASHVEVRVGSAEGGILLRVSDDGVGCDPAQALASRAGHLGLAALRERAESAGGHCQLLSLPGAGTTFEAWLPCAGADASARDAEPRSVEFESAWETEEVVGRTGWAS